MSNEETQLQRVDDYKHLFTSDTGARVLEDLCAFTQFQTPSFAESEDTSGRQMAFREGQKAVISYILWYVEMNRAEFQQQVRQAYSEDE